MAKKSSSRGKSAGKASRPSDRKADRKADPKPEPDDIARSVARLHIWQIQAVRDLLVVGSVVAIVWTGHALRAVTVPLLVALLLAYLFEPLIARMTKHSKVSRTGAIVIILGTFGSAVAIVLAVALPVAIGQATQFVRDVRDGTMRHRVEQLENYVPQSWRDEFQSVLGVLPALHGDSGDSAVSSGTGDATSPDPAAAPATGGETAPGQVSESRVNELISAAIDAERARSGPAAEQDWLSFARSGANTIFGLLGTAVQVGLIMFLIPFYFFFFSLGYPSVVQFGRQLIPDRNRQRTLDLIGHMDRVVAGFVRGRIVISAIMGLMLAIGWMICGVPYAIALGLTIGVFCAVPYLGGIGIPVAVALLAFQQLGLEPPDRMGVFGIIFWPTLVFAIVQLVEGYVLTPAIAGKATNLDPVTIIVAVLAGGSVLGVYGMLLAIPIAACAKILMTEVVLPHVRAWTRGEKADPLPLE